MRRKINRAFRTRRRHAAAASTAHDEHGDDDGHPQAGVPHPRASSGPHGGSSGTGTDLGDEGMRGLDP